MQIVWIACAAVALQLVAYQSLDMDYCVVHDGVLFRFCCVTGGQRDRRYIRHWIYERSARAATSETETFSGRTFGMASVSDGAVTCRPTFRAGLAGTQQARIQV